MSDEEAPDRPMSPEERKLASTLSREQVATIDAHLLEEASHQWRKVARLVARTWLANGKLGIPEALPDVYYSERIRHLVDIGKLEANGDLHRMRFSEVRLPQ